MTDERKPIMPWDSEEGFAESVVWWSRLDDRWQVEVRRADDDPEYDPGYRGELLIFDHTNNDRLVHSEHVGLAYGARFGPDVDDVNFWQQRTVELVDGGQLG